METKSLFIFFIENIPYSRRKDFSYKKDCRSVNVKSKNGKILDIGCKNTVTEPLIKTKK